RVRLTGTAAIDSEEFDSVARGAGLAGMISLVLVSFLLMYGLRSFRLVVSVLVTLVVGLIFTAAFAAVAIGHLNMISVAFAVLFIGLGADFGIHFALRYQEAIDRRVVHRDALQEAAIGVGGALALSAGAAAIAFYSFLPTSYLGVSELGLIAGTGMFVALILNLTLLPAILTLLPLSPPARPRRRRKFGVAAEAFIENHSRSFALGALAVGLAGLALVPQVRFDYNPINLKDFSTESVQAIRDLMRDSKTAPYTIGIVAADLDAAARLAARIKPLAAVDNAVTLRDYVPNDQKEKLEIIENMSLYLTPIIENTEIVARPSAAERAEAFGAFRAKIDRLLKSGEAGALTPKFRRLGVALDRFAESRSNDKGLAALEAGLVGSLGARLDDLRLSLTAAPVTLGHVPDEIRVRQVTGDGRARIEVFPAEDIIDNEAMRRFVDAVRGVAPNATDTPVLLLEAGDAIVGAFTQATITALVLITLLLLSLLRRVTDVLLVFAPLILAASLTVALSVLLGLWLNFANIIVLPLLLGLGVASGIHIVMRARRGHFSTLLGTSTPRAVVFSALTTVCSFGSLSVSGHRGTASMGELLMIAIGFTLVCALIVLPGLMELISHGGAKPGKTR
ncbi:MAG: MMPL family transporter, partial [Alphaproteobacteria bacterium]